MGSIEDRVNIGVAAVLIDTEGRFLLSERLADKHGKGTWGFPGGKPDPGEPPAEACLRELHEETGIVTGICSPLGVWTYERYEDAGIHFVTLYFLVPYEGQVPLRTEPEKHGPWEWLSYDEARERPLFSGCHRIMGLLVK